MTMLMRGTISVSVPGEVVVLLSIGEREVLGAGQVAEDSLCCLPVDAAGVVKETGEGRNCVSDVGTSGDRGIHEAADGLAVRGLFHLINFCGIGRAIVA